MGEEGSEREPDPRFTLANERTFLAWIRTALALIAGGVVLAELGGYLHSRTLARVFSLLPILAGVAIGVFAFAHWRGVRRAMRRGRPLPPPSFAPVLTGLVVVVGLGLGVFVFLR